MQVSETSSYWLCNIIHFDLSERAVNGFILKCFKGRVALTKILCFTRNGAGYHSVQVGSRAA
jgi:hypothetical protein